MASASGGSGPPATFKVKLLVSGKHNKMDNLVIIQKKLKDRFYHFKTFLTEKEGFTFLHIQDLILEKNSSEKKPSSLNFHCSVDCIEELDEFFKASKQGRISSALARYVDQNQLYNDVKPSSGLKMFMPLPKDTYHMVRPTLSARVQKPIARIVADTLIYGIHQANRVDPDETGPTGAVSSGSTLFVNTSNHITMSYRETPSDKVKVVEEVKGADATLAEDRRQARRAAPAPEQVSRDDIAIEPLSASPSMFKKFQIIIPNSAKRSIDKVRILSESCPQINEQKLYLRDIGIYMYECNVKIPLETLHEGISFYYEVQWSSGFFANVFFPPDKTKSEVQHLSSATVQRDVFYKSFEAYSVMMYIKDIIFNDAHTEKLKEYVMQIEELLNRRHVLPVDKRYIIHSICNDLKSYHNLRAVLCAIVIGNFLENLGPIDMIRIDKSKAELMLSKLVSHKLEEFPSSCEKYLSATCLCLSKLCLPSGTGLVQHMAQCYPLLNEAQLNLWFEDKHVASPVEADVTAVKELTCRAVSKLIVAESTEAATREVKAFINNLVCCTPLKVSLQIAKKLKCQDDIDLRLMFKETMEELFTRTCLHTKKSKDSSQLLLLWDFIATEEDLVSLYKPTVEEFILQHLGSFETGVDANMKKLISTHLLFENISSQSKLVQILGTSKYSRLHSAFTDVLHMSKFSDCLDEMSVTIIQNWFRTLISSHLKEKRVKVLYTYAFKILDIIPSSRKEEVKQMLDGLMVSYLEKMDIKEFLSGLLDTDSVCPEEYRDLCAYHVKEVLLANRKRLKPQDIFRVLTDSRGRLLLYTRFTAVAAVFALEAYCPLDEILAVVDRFRAMTNDWEMWKQILSCYGTFKYLLEESPSYMVAKSCISEILQMLHENDIPYQFYSEANLLDHNAREVLYLGEYSKTEVNHKLEENEKCLKEEKHRILVMQTVVLVIRDRVKKSIPSTFELFVKEIDQVVHGFDKMKMSEYVSRVQNLFKNQDVFKQCEVSSEVVNSQVYWNTFRKQADDLQLDSPDEEDEDDVLEGLCTLFGDISIDSHPKYTNCAGFVCKVLGMANKMYADEWNIIQNNPEIDMKRIFTMFKNCFDSVDKEIGFAEEHLHYRVSDDCKTCLSRLGKLKTITVVVNATVSAVKAFGLNLKEDADFHKAVTAFRDLLRDDGTTMSFKEVGNQLDVVFPIAEHLDESTTDVLLSIGESSSLIDFLRSIINEDIRNLIDAVEDISEQHVSETTVSALIEVKRFFKPLLETSEKTCISLIQSIQHQAQTLDKLASSLPSKIDDCMNNLHNLKSLYNNVANRGEQTKQIIQNIVKQGKFHFQLAGDQKVCDFTASYTQAKTKQKVIHSKSALCDFRSRALLLMNSDRHGSEKNMAELNKFVNSINCCLDVAEHAHDLHASGHLKYPDFIKSVPFNQLDDLLKSLLNDLHEWNAKLRRIRKEFYLMNFIQGSHIHVLDRYLQKGGKHEMVDIILKFLHSSLNAEILKQEYVLHKKEMEICGNFDVLPALGMALTSSFKQLTPFQRTVQATDDKEKRMTDIVESGRLLVARIDEGNVLVVKTLLALYLRTSSRIPEPSEVLVCTRETTWSEVELLLGRCFNAYNFYGTEALYCIANVEILPSEIHFRLVEELKNLNKNIHFKLAIICQGSANHPFIDEFYENVATVRPLSDETVRNIFLEVCPNVFTYTSESAGLGKTSAIISKAQQSRKAVKTLHISGPVLKRKLIERLKGLNLHRDVLLHIDIGFVDNPLELDVFLFEVIILKFSVADGMAIDLSPSHVCIEITNTINNTLRNSLQTAVSFQRRHLKWNHFQDFVVSTEINSPVQIVCHYLHSLEKGTVDKTDLVFSGDVCAKPLPTEVCRFLLHKYFSLSNTFIVTNTCIGVLADQLKKMSNSAFFKTSRIRDMTNQKSGSTVKSSMVNALLEVSKELANRSVDAYRTTQRQTLDSKFSKSAEGPRYDLAASATKHVEHMIRWEDSNHLIYVFHNQNIQTISPMYRELSLVPKHIRDLFESQMKRPLCDFKSLKQEELQDVLQKVARTNPVPLPPDKLVNLAKDYALTPDNLLKMVLIILRIKSRVPVLVMGETGCGKTSLIRYLAAICEVDFEVLSIHAGVEERTIVNKVLDYNDKAAQQLDQEKWLFLDEVNTSEYIGLISDMICHHRCLGKVLSPNLIILSACNPYKLRSSKSILTSGLTGKVKTDELSRLVYRVLPLPEMLVDYVWDFGSLTEKDEKMYIDRMVEGLFENSTSHAVFVDQLSMSQKFSRSIEETTSSVSLRDIQRCKILTDWFYHVLLEKTPTISMTYRSKPYNKVLTAIILSLTHCYLSRFSDKDIRKRYLEHMEAVFLLHSQPTYTAKHIQKIIREEQMDILQRMDLPPGTAQNTALCENVFVVLVCILNRIPIFVVGKPGCSKSLSLQVIKSNLRGKDSKDEFFKTLPQLYCVSFQGSESSTSDGILKVFEKAEKYQEANNTDDVLSVVILDEIGLAEISRFNPLKVLHNLLEPDGQIRPNVAVVGVSNWSLDASKMNRAIHLSRPEMDEEELYETAKSISDSFQKKQKKDFFGHMEDESYVFKTQDITENLKDLAKSYTDYMFALRFENFHGLRDYYSLIKYIAREISCAKQKPSEEEIQEIISCGIERNFGGLPAERETLFNKFNIAPTKVTPVLDLVTDNVNDPLARHLMIITTGQSAIGIIEKSLKAANRDKREILFGSQFEEDLTDDYNYRMLSRIILCMEQGMVLILKDLESIYGSLYDMLNKNYTEIGKKKHCRVALGAYSNPICHVHENFRCIVLVDETRVDFTDPPFLNRFEKQNVRFSDIIEESQKDIIDQTEEWIEQFCSIEGKHFTEEDSVPIYSTDLVASYVILKEESDKATSLESVKRDFMWVLKPDAVLRSHRASTEEVRNEADIYQEEFFRLPLHRGLPGLINFHRKSHKNENLMTIVFTNSSIHTRSLQSISEVSKQIEKLGAFKSEKQLSTRLQHFWTESEMEVLFIQCSAIDDEKHIMLAKSVVERYRSEFVSTNQTFSKHVYLLIHLDKSKGRSGVVPQINYLSGWQLVTLDSIELPSSSLPELCCLSLLEAVNEKRPMNEYITDQLFWTFTRIKYSRNGRGVDSINTTLNKMRQCDSFIKIVEEQVCSWIEYNYPGVHNTDWQETVACDPHALDTSLTFVDALEKHILQTINSPLCKFIYQMECMGIIDSYFVEDEVSEERRLVWTKLLTNTSLFSIVDIHDELGPETFNCEMEDLSLKMPFCLHIWKCVETTREEYLNSVTMLQGLCNLDEDEDLPDEVVDKLLKKQEMVILDRLPELETFLYDRCMNDYIRDFCSIITFGKCPGLDKTTKISIMKWILEQRVDLTQDDFSVLLTNLHTTFWSNSGLFFAQLQLFELCQSEDMSEEGIDMVDTIIKELSAVEDHPVPESYEDDGEMVQDAKFQDEIDQDLQDRLTNLYTSEECGTSQADFLMSSDVLLSNELKSDLETSTVESENFENVIESNKDSTDATYEIEDGSTVESENVENVIESNKDSTDAICTVEDGVNEETSEDGKISIVEDNEIEIEEDSLIEGSSTTKHWSEPAIEMNDDSNDGLDGAKYELSEDSFEEVIGAAGEDSETDFEEEDNTSEYSFTSYEWSGSSSITSDDDVQYFNTESKLVDILCKKMFPTEEVVAHHSGLAAWCWKVNYMLRLAANVSDEPPSLHALRLCNDIATELFQTTMHSASFGTIAEHLKSGKALDTKAVFSTLIKLLNERRKDMSKKCQRIFSNYLLRCLALSSETKAMELFLLAVKKGMVPDRQLSYLKLPLSTKLKIETWEFQMDILQKPDTWEDEETSTFIVLLDECLKATFKGKNALSNLVIDILLEIYMDAFSEEDEEEAIFKDLFLDGHRCLKCGFGLSFIAGVAYCKAYIECFLLKDGALSEEFLSEVLPVFQSTSEDEITHSLLMYFIKMLGLKSPMAMFWIYCKSQKDKLPFVDKFRWLQEDEFDISLCAEMCPMRVHASVTAENVVHLIKTTDRVAIFKEWEMIFTNSKNNYQCIVGILGAAMSHFYLSRIHTEIDDTKDMKATELRAISEKSSLTRSRKLLKCLLGKQDFEVPDLMIHRGSSSTDFYISSVLVSLYILLLAEQECSTSGQMSVLTSCLLKPTRVKNTYLPGVPESNVSATDSVIGQLHESSGTLYSTCRCGIRLCSTHTSILCVNCSSVNNGVEEFPAPDFVDYPSKPGFVPSNSETTVRKLSPVTFNILSLLTKGCLLGSVALGHANTNDIEDIGVPENALQVLWNDLESHWKRLLVIMNMEEYHLSFLFQALFVKIRKFICEEKKQLTTMTERCDWEESFTLLVKDVLAEKFSSVNEIFDHHRHNGAPGLFEMESCLRELGGEGNPSTEHQQPPMMELFRLHGQPSMENFLSEFYNVRQQFPFLQLVLQSYKELSMPKHVMPIVQWHLIVTSTVSYTMKKHDCMSMTVTEFIHLTDEEDARKTRRNCFDAFKKAWDELKGYLKDTDVLTACPDRFHGLTKLSECLILDENSALYKVLCFLVQIHNRFLDKSLAVAHGCNSVKFLCRKPDVSMIPCVNVAKINAKQLVDFSAQWEEWLTNDSQSDLAYGSGRHIVYDFFSIEKSLAVHLLNGKAYVNVEDDWPRIIFTDELYRNFASLIKELRECIKQTHIPKQTVQSIHANHEKDPKMATELLTHLGIIMALLKKTKGDPDMALVDYVENWKMIMTRSLPEDLLPSPSNCIKLGHVVALHEILEELSATSIVDALEEDYRHRMDTDMESHFYKLVQNQLKVSEVILGTMKRFVYRCLSIRDAYPALQMVEYLADESFWPVDVCADERIHMGDDVFCVGDLIPEGLMVSHIYSTVTFLEEEINKKRSTDLNLSKMATSFNVIDASKSPAKRKEHKIRKKTRGLRNF